jgi:hypothetical protein
MISRKPLYVQQPPSYVFLGVTMQIHLSGVQTGDEFSLIGATMPPGGDGGLHLHTREDAARALLINTPRTFDKFVQIAGTPVSQDASTPGFPDPEQTQRLLALAEEFGVRILAPPELPTRN